MKRAMAVYDRATQVVVDEDKFEVCHPRNRLRGSDR